MFFHQIPSAALHSAEPEANQEAPQAPNKISFHPLNFFLQPSLTLR